MGFTGGYVTTCLPQQKESADFKVRTVLKGIKSPEGIAASCRRDSVSHVSVN